MHRADEYLQGGYSGDSVCKADSDVLGCIIAASLHARAADSDGSHCLCMQALPMQELPLAVVQLQMACRGAQDEV